MAHGYRAAGGGTWLHLYFELIGRYGATGVVGVVLALALASPAQAQTVRVTQAPTMTGQMRVGQTLEASGGRADYAFSTTYVWIRCDDNTPNTTVAEEQVQALDGLPVAEHVRRPRAATR